MKAIFLDVDGTLRDWGIGIPQSARKAIRLARENGHKVFVNTGRPRCTLDKEVLGLELDGYICGCGSQVYLDGELLCDHQLSHEESVRIVEGLRAAGLDYVLESPDRMYSDKINVFDLGRKSTPEMEEEMAIFAKNTYKLGKELPPDFTFTKFICPSQEYDKLREIVGESMEVLNQGEMGAEVVQRVCSKGTGIDVVCQKLGITLEDCYAIGDSSNDLGMLTHVAHGVAMGNALPDILPYCEFQTTSVEQDGIYNAFRHYGLI